MCRFSLVREGKTMQNNTIEQEIQQLLARMDGQHEQGSEEEKEPEAQTPGQDEQEIQNIYVLVVRESADTDDPPEHIIEATLTPTKTETREPIDPLMCATGIFFLILVFSSLLLQMYMVLNPPIATVTLIPRSQTVTLTGMLQLGRVLQPLTISQSQTTATTGKGHQSAKAANGYITFYNGQFQSVTVAAGTILTGASGTQIVTDQDAIIPPGNPPSYGQISVSAHAINSGVRGNIPSYDINQACCATSVLAKNTQPFSGGQDERTYTTVTQKDINSISTVLKTTLAQSITGALQGQLHQGEVLQLLPCSPTVTSDHQPEEEATQVKVTVSETCSAAAYNSQELATKATTFLSTQALQKTGAGYSLFGTVHVSVKQASVTNSPHPLVFLSFHASATWVYGLSRTAQEQIKHLIAGKTTQQTVTLLASLPGVEHAAIRFTGFGDDTKLPRNTGYIHLTIFVV
jgi:hypothetical protein